MGGVPTIALRPEQVAKLLCLKGGIYKVKWNQYQEDAKQFINRMNVFKRREMTQGEKQHQSLVKRLGSEGAVKEWRRKIGAKGGEKGTTGGFYANRELARKAGAKGGKISRRRR